MKKYLFVALLLSAFALAACGGGTSDTGGITLHEIPAEYVGWTNPLMGDAAAVAAGKVVFEQNCVSCHGATGVGDGEAGVALDPPPADLHKVNELAGEDFIYFVINEGVEGTSMVSWKGTLSEEQIQQVAAYIRTTFTP
ncbi:MAG: cytochrome c [Chloroflexota bacterium]